MLVAQLLDSCRQRVPWPTMRSILRMCDLPVGRGWEDSIKKLTNEIKIESESPDGFDKLKEYYSNHLLVGEKSLKLFPVNRSRIDKLINLLKGYEVKTTPFHETYPFPLSNKTLQNISSSPQLVEIRDSQTSLSVVFCTKRFFSERVEIKQEELDANTREALDDYDELIGIKRHTRQFFDTVVLWKNKELVEIRVDTTSELSSLERSQAFIQTIKQFNNLAKKILGIETLLKDNINLFPLIDCLYTSDEGKVGELAFTTDEGSIKSEKMRRGAVDLRDETYHKAGRKAVDHITPYRLAILWNYQLSEEVETQPELLLPGQARFLSDSTQILGEVIVRKCSGLEDYNFVFDKIIEYLKVCS